MLNMTRSKFTEGIILAITFLGVFILAYLLKESATEFTAHQIIQFFSLLICFCLILMLYTFYKFYRSLSNTENIPIIKEFESVIARMENLYTSLNNTEHLPIVNEFKRVIMRMESTLSKCKFETSIGDSFFISAEALIVLEKNIDAGEIIIMTPELSLDVEGHFYSVILANIAKRNVKYTYVLPDQTPLVDGQTKDLVAQLIKDIDWLNIETINHHIEFFYIHNKYVVNGITLHCDCKNGYINVPNRKYEKEIFIRMDKEFYLKTLGCIYKLINPDKPEKNKV